MVSHLSDANWGAAKNLALTMKMEDEKVTYAAIVRAIVARWPYFHPRYVASPYWTKE
jgi:hypothetical protein